MDATLEASARWGGRFPVWTLGPLIHNPQALDHLARRGIRAIQIPSNVGDGVLVIRAHGIPWGELRWLQQRRRTSRQKVVNATCPEVARVQAALRHHGARGGFAIILGQADHPEVAAHRSYATAGHAVVRDLSEAEALPDACLDHALVVAQTTFDVETFHAIANHLQARCSSLKVRNTICRETFQRQEEAGVLAASMDALVVVGGRDSNNTRQLVDVARRSARPVQWVETAEDLDLDALERKGKVGVLAGASTPTWTVDEVVEALETAGHPSALRLARRLAMSLQGLLVLAIAGTSLLVQHSLGWKGWACPTLPAAFHLSLCALLPYVDAFGLERNGRVHSRFLGHYRRVLLVVGASAGLFAVWAAISQGLLVVSGTLLMAAAAVAYVRYPASALCNWMHRLPAAKDLGQALEPVLLVILLPWVQGRSATPGRLFAAASAVFGLALAAHSLRHLRAFRENRILGREVVAVAIGSRNTRWMAWGLILVSLAVWVLEG
jgi:4-hydroxy-3-methylbut-2-enyl diphosphate reductase